MPNFIRDVEEIRQRAIRNLEEGAVTEAYELDPEKSVAILNEALATEIVCVLRYLHHYFMATGVHAKAVAGEFKEHADAEREHADEIAERIQQLGGKPDFNPRTLLERSAAQYVEGETLGDMIREDLIAERIVIDVYSQMIRYFGEKDPTTRVMLEHILSEEEEHASELSDLLYIVEPSTGETEGVDPGVHPLRMHGGQQRDEEEEDERGAREQRKEARGRQPRSTPQRGQASQGRSQGIANRQSTEQFAGRVAVNAGRDAASASGTTGRRRREDEDATSIDPKEEGGMGGGSRAVRIANKQRKNRAA